MKANKDYPHTVSCLTATNWFKNKGRFSKTPSVGDWVMYGNNGGTHVEIVVKVTSTTITTIGGNTSGSLGGKYYNGDGVYQKTVSRSNSRIHGYGHPYYSKDAPKPVPAKKAYPGRILKLRSPMMSGGDVKDVQNRLRKLGYKLDVDGWYGPVTRSRVVAFQKKAKVSADGEVGPITWRKLFP